jgi:hypothetical protein
METVLEVKKKIPAEGPEEKIRNPRKSGFSVWLTNKQPWQAECYHFHPITRY